MWIDSVLLCWNEDVHNHLIAIPEQAGKTGEMGLTCLYQFLVCGCSPVVTVKNAGGRQSGGKMMENSLNSQLSGAPMEHGLTPSIKDYLLHIVACHPTEPGCQDWRAIDIV